MNMAMGGAMAFPSGMFPIPPPPAGFPPPSSPISISAPIGICGMWPFPAITPSYPIPSTVFGFMILPPKKNEKIDAETTAFGIVNGDVLYVKESANQEKLLYKYNTKECVSDFLYSFNHNSETYNDYNFTEKYLTFFENGLNVLNLENGLVNTHQLPGYAKFMSCYMDYAFICLEKGIYRINLSSGETEMLFSDFDECHLIHAISDKCAVIVCYVYNSFFHIF